MSQQHPENNDNIVATVDDDEATGSPENGAAVARVEHDEIVVDDVADDSAAEPAGASATDSSAPGGDAVLHYVYVPNAAVKRGNRLFGSLVALGAAWVYGGVLAVVLAAISVAFIGRVDFSFIARPTFYIPVLFFATAMVIIVAIANRAGWWSYIIGSAFVALVVYFGSTGVILLINGVVLATPQEAGLLFREVLSNPVTIATALVAREVAIWAGLVISRRGKRVRAENLAAQETFVREKAEREASVSTATI